VELENEPYAGLVEDLVQVLNHADMHEILADFGRRTRQDDPTVHFYETFLAAYDPRLRERRGVYYTPNPVVSYIVRSVDALLKSEFNLPGGLADTTKVDDDRHKVLILDPACGTATFLYHVIALIREEFMLGGNAGMWSSYVRDHLLPRIFGFELLMAPYAVAHFKLALQLAGHDLPEAQQDAWAYDFGSEERLQIYLTNALEKAIEEPPRLIGPTRIVTREAQAANQVKQDMPIMVVIGNPPYSVSSSNQGEHIEELMDSYKEAVRDEQNIQPLSDDYIKFIRFAHDRVERTGYGVIGMITNHTYLSGLIHRGMREELLKTFDQIYVLNLHGNAVVKETAPDGSKDENVFDIRQGVAIVFLVKSGSGQDKAKVAYADLWGRRKSKYSFLNDVDIFSTKWESITPDPPYFFFVPKNFSRLEEYERGKRVDHIFAVSSTGVKTHRDHFVVDFDQEVLKERISVLRRDNLSDESIRERFGLNDTRDWKLSDARQSLEMDAEWDTRIEPYLYRPFDARLVYYSSSIVELTRYDVMRHMLPENSALIVGRAGHVVQSDTWNLVFCGNRVIDTNVFYRGGGVVLPLYLYPEESAATLFDNTAISPWEPNPDCGSRVPNLSKDFVEDFEDTLDLPFDAHKTAAAPGDTFGPRDILAYIYAIFHSPTYRERYAEFLKIDFPRVPLTSDVELFWRLVALGDELIQLHLMEHPKLNDTFTSFPVSGSDRVKRYGGFPKFIPAGESRTKTGDVAQKNRVYINLDQYFTGVPKDVWEFEVGGYQVLHKWLKDRKDRVLSYDEMEHYQKIIVALQETMRLMEEIDETIPAWPIE
jgi:predicted helicase